MPRFLRFGWQRVDATLVDQRFVRRASYNVERGDSSYQVWEYMVDVPHPDGSTTRLTFEEKSFEVELPAVGGTVPVLVNRRGTKAMFDLDDPRIGFGVRMKARERARAERDKVRFDKKLGR